ncbi:hypothetical protein GNI_075900 [Gregarina niphandrodes]|uniref:Uncharacterized protein n=1 Tax=Gregarina niphandrodes TaxID=110365 RepID=A0A023B6U7_GRENI|nr:hypothetical protein GNI_075900 [Gregarina niphandrodes]EZG66777.1 hypothetical protein GNI_075900 [Gregarina niphandrodes]|eukprot:XP_011130488.1 hypothetical protein GNI_075900 [Gregarina niphandrodes]
MKVLEVSRPSGDVYSRVSASDSASSGSPAAQSDASRGDASPNASPNEPLAPGEDSPSEELEEIPYAMVTTEANEIWQCWAGGKRLINLASAGAETTSSVYLSMHFSFSGKFGAFRTDDGFLVIAPMSALRLPVGITAAAATEVTAVGLAATVVTTPSLVADQLVWLGDHCVAMAVRTPTSVNASQSCVFIGGPGSKWMDLLFPSPVILVEGRDVKYVSYDCLGVVQYTESATLQTFGPGSCHPAAMICFAIDSNASQHEQWSSDDEDTESASRNAGLAPELSKLRENLRRKKCDAALGNEDLTYLFFRRRWQQRRLGVRQRLNDAADFLDTLSLSEKENAYAVLTDAVQYEYDVRNIVVILKAIRLLVPRIKREQRRVPALQAAAEPQSAARVNFSLYYRLIRDFRVLHLLRARLELLLTYQDFQSLKLPRVVGLCCRDADLALDLCDAYDLSRVRRAPRGRVAALREALDTLRDGVLLDRVVLAVSQKDGAAVERELRVLWPELLGAPVPAEVGSGGLRRCLRELAARPRLDVYRGAAWACLKFQHRQLAKTVMRHERTPSVVLYFLRLVEDHAAIFRYGLAHDDTDALDYAVYLHCQSVLLAGARPAALHSKYNWTQLEQLILAEAQAVAAGEAEPGVGTAVGGKTEAGGKTGGSGKVMLGAGSLYAAAPQLAVRYVEEFFRRRGSELPLATADRVWERFLGEYRRHWAAPEAAAGAGATFISSLINTRSFMKDSRKGQVQRHAADVRRLSKTAAVGVACSYCQSQACTSCAAGLPAPWLERYADLLELHSRVCVAGVSGGVLPVVSPHTTDGSVKALAQDLIVRNNEKGVAELLGRLEVPLHVLLLWKLEVLAALGEWGLFCEFAVQAVRAAVPALESRLSAGAALFASRRDDFFARLQRPRDANKLQSLVGGVLSLSKSTPALAHFAPILPSEVQQPAERADKHCPKELGAFDQLPVVDFVAVAKNHDKPNVALCLVPYIHSTLLREKWGGLLGLKSVEQFATNAIECAAAKCGKKLPGGKQGDYQLFLQLSREALENRKAMSANLIPVHNVSASKPHSQNSVLNSSR